MAHMYSILTELCNIHIQYNHELTHLIILLNINKYIHNNAEHDII
jgi:hypothetical protein